MRISVKTFVPILTSTALIAGGVILGTLENSVRPDQTLLTLRGGSPPFYPDFVDGDCNTINGIGPCVPGQNCTTCEFGWRANWQLGQHPESAGYDPESESCGELKTGHCNMIGECVPAGDTGVWCSIDRRWATVQ